MAECNDFWLQSGCLKVPVFEKKTNETKHNKKQNQNQTNRKFHRIISLTFQGKNDLNIFLNMIRIGKQDLILRNYWFKYH